MSLKVVVLEQDLGIGLLADRAASPLAGDEYVATDTEEKYICFVDDTWVRTAFVPAEARVFRSVTQAIPTSTWTTIAFDQEDRDTKSMHAAGVFTVPTGGAGRYLFLATLGWSADAAGNRGTRIFVNGATNKNRTFFPNAGSGNFATSVVSDIVDLADGDTVEIQGWQSSGADLNTIAGEDRTHCEMWQMS